MAISHANCTHPRTPAGRSACRSLRANLAANIDPTAVVTSTSVVDHGLPRAAARLMDRVETNREIRMTGAVARRIARQAAAADNARIQPRRSGARVSATKSACVQAALHTGNSLCACGHRSGSYALAV